MLEAKLAALGDLTKQLSISSIYQGPLVEAAKQFQLRHGLETRRHHRQGHIGTTEYSNQQPCSPDRTIDGTVALDAIADQRADDRGQYPGIHAARLWGPDGNATHLATSMRVIVGKAIKQKDPVFSEELRHIRVQPVLEHPLIDRHQNRAATTTTPNILNAGPRVRRFTKPEHRTPCRPRHWIRSNRAAGSSANAPGDHNAIWPDKVRIPQQQGYFTFITPLV